MKSVSRVLIPLFLFLFLFGLNAPLDAYRIDDRSDRCEHGIAPWSDAPTRVVEPFAEFSAIAGNYGRDSGIDDPVRLHAGEVISSIPSPASPF